MLVLLSQLVSYSPKLTEKNNYTNQNRCITCHLSQMKIKKIIVKCHCRKLEAQAACSGPWSSPGSYKIINVWFTYLLYILKYSFALMAINVNVLYAYLLVVTSFDWMNMFVEASADLKREGQCPINDILFPPERNLHKFHVVRWQITASCFQMSVINSTSAWSCWHHCTYTLRERP